MNAGRKPDPHYILCLASFKSLNEYQWCEKLQNIHEIQEVYIRQVAEPIQEKTLKLNIPILGEISDSTSVEVRDQYEQNPYPRWVNTGIRRNPETSNVIKKLA